MARVRSRDTKPEMRVRRAAHMAGYRFRIHRSDLPGRPDLVFPRYRLAVFVHGCFWHRHGCGRTTMPATNAEFWSGKFRRTVERDQRALRKLEKAGWAVRVIWECRLESGISRLIETLAQAAQPPKRTSIRA